MTTMMLFARALSFTPRISSHVINITIANAGTLIENRNARDLRRGLRAVHEQPGSELSSAARYPVRQPHRQRDTSRASERLEVFAPRDRDRDVSDRVLEDQIPADDPGDDLAERRVRVRVRASRLRNHRRQLGVTQRRRARRPRRAA